MGGIARGGEIVSLRLSGGLEWQSREGTTEVGQPCFNILFRYQVDLVENQYELLAVNLYSLLLNLPAPCTLRISSIENLDNYIALANHLSKTLCVKTETGRGARFRVVRVLSPRTIVIAVFHCLVVQGGVGICRIGQRHYRWVWHTETCSLMRSFLLLAA